MDIDGSLENMLNVFSVLYVTRTLSNGTINGYNLHSSTIQLNEEVSPLFSGSKLDSVGYKLVLCLCNVKFRLKCTFMLRQIKQLFNWFIYKSIIILFL